MRLPESWTFEDRPTCDGPRKWAPPSLNGGFGLEVRKIGSYYRAELFVPPAINTGRSWDGGVWVNADDEDTAIRCVELLARRFGWVEDRDA